MKLSVIIPVYNGEKTIKETLDSLFSQTLSDIEVIVVNDGSTDNTLEILRSFTDKRLKVITIENSGQGIARNKGLEIAEGEYVGFVDADDSVECDMFERMYYSAQENSSQMVQCAINDIRNSCVTVRPWLEDIALKIENPEDYADNYFYTLKHTNEVCNKIFLKSFLEENALTFADTRRIYSEDLRFNIALLPYLKSVSFVSKPLYNYYIKSDGHCLKNPEKRFVGIFRLYEESIAEIRLKRLKRCIESSAVITLLSYFASAEDGKEMRKIITSKEFKKYLFDSLVYKRSLKHSLLMLMLILTPYPLKRKLIKKHYTFQ